MTVTTYQIETRHGIEFRTTNPMLAEAYSAVLDARVTARTEA